MLIYLTIVVLKGEIKPLRYAVNISDLDTLLAACHDMRDKTIISMLADTGLRPTELASIKRADVDLGENTILVWGKGAKQRLVRYGPRTHSFLVDWLERHLRSFVYHLARIGRP